MEDNLEEKSTLVNQGAEENVKPALSKHDLIEEIVVKTEQRNKKKNKAKDKLIRLISGEEIDVDVIAAKIQKHPSQFPQELYDEIYRVYRISGDPKQYNKDKVCADLTIECVYSRFKRDVLPTIQQQNKYKGYCQREHKYYQFLTHDGIMMLQGFIGDTINALRDCTSEIQFRKLMFERHTVSYQIDAFNQN